MYADSMNMPDMIVVGSRGRAGLTLCDAQKLRGLTNDGSVLSENMSTFLALELYLDFVNMFMNILQLLGGCSLD